MVKKKKAGISWEFILGAIIFLLVLGISLVIYFKGVKLTPNITKPCVGGEFVPEQQCNTSQVTGIKRELLQIRDDKGNICCPIDAIKKDKKKH